MDTAPRLLQVAAEQPYPLLFLTISGAHLYGFPSADSDCDLRGAHILPAVEVLGLKAGKETIETCQMREGLEIELVTHDVLKFSTLVLKKNGYVLEQLFSPLVVQTTPEHEELRAIARQCITRHHAHHYLGFAANQWKLFLKETPPRVKPLLYVYRVLLTGIHLMRTGEVEANLVRLNEHFGLPFVDDLIARKVAGTEDATLDATDIPFHQGEYERLTRLLEDAYGATTLPANPAGRDALHDLLVRLRLRSLGLTGEATHRNRRTP